MQNEVTDYTDTGKLDTWKQMLIAFIKKISALGRLTAW